MWVKSLITNWTTSIPSLLAFLCGAAELIGLIPDEYERYAVAACTFLLATGLAAAKSAGVSNAPKPVAATVVSKADAEKTNPSATTPITAWLPIIFIMGLAMSLTACDTLGPLVGQYKNKLESIIGVAVAGHYTVLITKDGKTLVTETWNCTTDGTKLTGCHKVGSRTVSPDVVAPEK